MQYFFRYSFLILINNPIINNKIETRVNYYYYTKFELFFELNFYRIKNRNERNSSRCNVKVLPNFWNFNSLEKERERETGKYARSN